MRKHLLTYLLYALVCLLVHPSISLAQQSTTAEEQVVEQKTFDQKEWEALQEELDYSGTPKKEKEKKKEAKKDRSFSPPQISMPNGIMYIGALVLIVLLGALLYVVFTQDQAENTTIEKQDGSLVGIEQLAEELDKREVDPYIRQAEAALDYPLAVRLHYLALLKKLNEVGHIKWRKNYTNKTYIRQMQSNVNASNFKQLTATYERIWYGDHAPSAEEYGAVKTAFVTLIQKVNKVEQNA